MELTHDYVYQYEGYGRAASECRVRIYEGPEKPPVFLLQELESNPGTSITNMAEYLAAEVIKERSLPTPLTWIEHYPEHEGEVGEYSLVMFSAWELEEDCLGGVWRCRVGSPAWSPISSEDFDSLVEDMVSERRPPSTVSNSGDSLDRFWS